MPLPWCFAMTNNWFINFEILKTLKTLLVWSLIILLAVKLLFLIFTNQALVYGKAPVTRCLTRLNINNLLTISPQEFVSITTPHVLLKKIDKFFGPFYRYQELAFELLLKEQTGGIIGNVIKTLIDQTCKQMQTHYIHLIECIPMYSYNKEIVNSRCFWFLNKIYYIPIKF